MVKNFKGLEMVVHNDKYEEKMIEFDEGDYLKGISGTIDKKKNFTKVIFVTANKKTYEAGT